MPTADLNHILFKIAHPDLYERNPFNVLNLPVTATVRDIRRRKEDIEAAFDAGNEAEEFVDILPLDKNRKPPTRDESQAAFAALEDPEKRITYALFWFWPDAGTGSREYERLFKERGIVTQWRKKTKSLPEGPEKAVTTHNLAVFQHLMALGYERSLLHDEAWNGATPNEVREHWTDAIHFWNAVAKDAETWHAVSDLVAALGDPRIDYRFARSLRDQFAFAFDQINVELAIAFAKVGRKDDAKRQLECMALSQPDTDDVEGTFDDAFSGLLRQVEAVVKSACNEVDKNPKDGLRQAKIILEQTDEPLRISRIVLGKGTSIRNAIVSAIFTGVRHCLIAYGNATHDWNACIEITEALKVLAETPDQSRVAENDAKIVADNKKAQDERERCWFCKTHNAVEGFALSIAMHKEVSRTSDWGGRTTVRYQKMKLLIPRCASCKEKHERRSSLGDKVCLGIVSFVFLVVTFGFAIFGKYESSWEMIIISGFRGGLITALIGGIVILVASQFFGPKYQDYPAYIKLQNEGWELGESPER